MAELVIVVVVIAILASITFAGYNKVQIDARDTTRRATAKVIAEALERYYGKNGEYPSVRSLSNAYAGNTGTVVAAKLAVKPTDLKMPKMPPSATNAIFAGPAPANDYIAYIAVNAVDAASCQTVLAGGCDEFTLRYLEESGTTVNVESRRKGHPTQ